MSNRRNIDFLRKASERISSEAKPGFHGEVSVRFTVQDGVIQHGHVEKSTRASKDGSTVIVEKSKLK